MSEPTPEERAESVCAEWWKGESGLANLIAADIHAAIAQERELWTGLSGLPDWRECPECGFTDVHPSCASRMICRNCMVAKERERAAKIAEGHECSRDCELRDTRNSMTFESHYCTDVIAAAIRAEPEEKA